MFPYSAPTAFGGGSFHISGIPEPLQTKPLELVRKMVYNIEKFLEK